MSGEVNIPLLRKAVEWAEVEAAKPTLERRWRQADYVTGPLQMAIAAAPEGLGWSEALRFGNENAHRCGTAYCIAGYVGQLLDERYADSSAVDGVHVEDFAAAALGISTDDHSASAGLFDAANTIEDVRRIAEEIAGERL